MFADDFQTGGPVMYVVFAAWVVVFAGVLDRLLYAFSRSRRRALAEVAELVGREKFAVARTRIENELSLAQRGVARIDSVSQLATSLGLFGTVLGIARSFFSRSEELGLAAPEVLASGLSTALFTTIAGLIVFLFGQGFIIVWREWSSVVERTLTEPLGERSDG